MVAECIVSNEAETLSLSKIYIKSIENQKRFSLILPVGQFANTIQTNRLQ